MASARGITRLPARLEVNSAEGLMLWVDGNPVSDLVAPIRFATGRHALTFGFRPKQRERGLRVELKAVDGQGKFQPEGGL